jgi:hypothetical protein
MIRMDCKPPLLQHPLTNCHIITLREMQKIKMNTTAPNQNKYNTKNTPASRPNKLQKKEEANPFVQQTHAGRGFGQTHSGRGSGEHDCRGSGKTHAGRGLASMLANWPGSRRP